MSSRHLYESQILLFQAQNCANPGKSHLDGRWQYSLHYAANPEGRTPMRKLKVAAVQLRCAARREDNLAHAEALVREAAAKGAQLVLLPELWERPYFCQERRYEIGRAHV